MEELRNLGEMTFKNVELNEHIAKYKELYMRFEESIKKKNKDQISACEEEFSTWYTEMAKVLEKLSVEEIAAFAPYGAKLSIQWNDLRMKSLE